jgi:hypothetical protein
MHKFYSPYYLPPKPTKEIANEKLATFQTREDIKNFIARRVANKKSYSKRYKEYVRENREPHGCRCVSYEEQKSDFENLQQLPMLLHPLDVPIEYASTGPEPIKIERIDKTKPAPPAPPEWIRRLELIRSKKSS